MLRAWKAAPDNSEVQRVIDELTSALGAEMLAHLGARRDSQAQEYFTRIQQLAQEVPGVKWVQNQISVAPPPKAG